MGRILRNIAIGLLGWLLLSMLALLPQEMSLPVPERMQSYTSNLYHTGYTWNNTLKDIWANAQVEPGTFDSLKLNTNNNLANGSYSDGEYLFFAGGTTSRTTSAMHLGDEPSELISEKYARILIPLDGYSAILRDDKRPNLYLHDATRGSDSWTKYFTSYTDKGKAYQDERKIAALAARSQTEAIRPVELLGLLQFSCIGVLQGWYPDEQVAVIKMYNSKEEFTITRYHTDQPDGEGFVTDEFGPCAYTLPMMVDSVHCIAYDAENQFLVWIDTVTGEEFPFLTEVPALKSLLYCYNAENERIIAALTDDGDILWDNLDHDGVVVLDPDQQTDQIALTPDHLILINHGVNSSWTAKQIPHSSLEEEES